MLDGVKRRLDLGLTSHPLSLYGLRFPGARTVHSFAHGGRHKAFSGLLTLFALLARVSHVDCNNEHEQEKEADVEGDARSGSILEKFGLFHASTMQPAA